MGLSKTVQVIRLTTDGENRDFLVRATEGNLRAALALAGDVPLEKGP